MRIVFALLVLVLLGLSSSATACPTIRGEDPAADMKLALDHYAKIGLSGYIAGADCAKKHFEVARAHDAQFREAKSSSTYRYGRLLAEIADLQSKAGTRLRQSGGGTGVKYFRDEIEVRVALLKWCLGDRLACDVYKQLGSLANAYENAGEAADLHDWMLSNSPESLAVKDALKIWLRAVYSCPAWDFRPPTSGSLFTWKEKCSPGCMTVARQAGETLKKHGTRISSLADQISALTASVEKCDKEGGHE